MLMPKRVKWRKQQRGRMTGKALRGAEISFGEFALQAVEPGWVSARQIEAARRAIVREMKRRGKVWIRIFPDHPYTRKPPETRMGKGKGSVEYWVAVRKKRCTRLRTSSPSRPRYLIRKNLEESKHEGRGNSPVIGS